MLEKMVAIAAEEREWEVRGERWEVGGDERCERGEREAQR
jgi:hypothetical protein